tara:strand:- start:389 stop:1084 length:696 start_codon:yes stop_codon:yes gene_type:complete
MTILPNYDAVAAQTWQHSDFVYENLAQSRSLFDFLSCGTIKPRNFEVYALVAGLPFSGEMRTKILSLQRSIGSLVKHDEIYWVKARNLATEFIVFKWPEQGWDRGKEGDVLRAMQSLKFEAFEIKYSGFQVNPDGCVVVKGFDGSGQFSLVRDFFKRELSFLSVRQSAWFHIPIGRILRPVGTKNFRELRRFIEGNSSSFLIHEPISTLALVHETRWYMEEREIINTVSAA